MINNEDLSYYFRIIKFAAIILFILFLLTLYPLFIDFAQFVDSKYVGTVVFILLIIILFNLVDVRCHSNDNSN